MQGKQSGAGYKYNNQREEKHKYGKYILFTPGERQCKQGVHNGPDGPKMQDTFFLRAAIGSCYGSNVCQ